MYSEEKLLKSLLTGYQQYQFKLYGTEGLQQGEKVNTLDGGK
jgi:hypothetical protein